jgi:hypothetical protein
LHDRFLSLRTRTRTGAPLGRIFSVIQQTWQVADDPRRTKPKETAIATRRTAADAADVAHDAAVAFRSHGFHKASGAWWGADGELFHRFLVAPDRPQRRSPLLLGIGVAALALVAIGARRSADQRSPKAGA